MRIEAKTTEVKEKVEEKGLQLLLSNALDPLHKKTPIHGATLYIDAPRIRFEWNGAAGTQDPSSNALLTPQHPIRIASISKTYVAAAILRLWEDQRLDLDKSIAESISTTHSHLMTDSGYPIDCITPRHLLSHTSGLYDWGDCPVYAAKVSANPQYPWTRTEQLQIAMTHGTAYGKPGEVYRYSDTGYILLGEIVERITGLSLGEALRELIDYDRLGLNRTWLESVEPVPAGTAQRAHQFHGKNDTYRLNPSMDIFGGGGLVATMEDVGRFFRALFSGALYIQPHTLETMLSTIKAQRGGPDYHIYPQIPGAYRLGIEAMDIAGFHVYGHGGFWGTFAAYVPKLDVAISLSLTQHFTHTEKMNLFRQVLLWVQNTTQELRI